MIKTYDTVTVCLASGYYLEDAKILHSPNDVGDFWYFLKKDGEEIAINPSAINHIIRSREKKKGKRNE